MKNDFWNQKGCDECREDALRGAIGVLKQVMSKPFMILYQCPICSTYWVENPREMHPVTVEEVKRHFPEYAIG